MEKYALITILKSDFIEWFNRKTTRHCGAGSALQAPVDSEQPAPQQPGTLLILNQLIRLKNLDILAVYDECLHIQINF